MIAPFIFVSSVIIGSLTFLLSIIVCILHLIDFYIINEYYTILGLLIVSTMGFYFIMMYLHVYFAYRDASNTERLNKSRILEETNVRPKDDYSIRIVA
jgi:uncharacterized membrane protein